MNIKKSCFQLFLRKLKMHFHSFPMNPAFFSEEKRFNFFLVAFFLSNSSKSISIKVLWFLFQTKLLYEGSCWLFLNNLTWGKGRYSLLRNFWYKQPLANCDSSRNFEFLRQLYRFSYCWDPDRFRVTYSRPRWTEVIPFWELHSPSVSDYR